MNFLEVIKRAVRIVSESNDEYESQWAAIASIAAKTGCTAATLRRQLHEHKGDSGRGHPPWPWRAGLSSAGLAVFV